MSPRANLSEKKALKAPENGAAEMAQQLRAPAAPEESSVPCTHIWLLTNCSWDAGRGGAGEGGLDAILASVGI